MSDELFNQLGFGGGGTATSPRQSQGYRVLQPGAGAGARAKAPAQGGARIEPLTSARYPMKPGPSPARAMPALPPNQAAAAPAMPGPPKYNPATYDPVAEYASLRTRLGMPEGPPAPMPVQPRPMATGMAETFMAPAQQQAGVFAAARQAQGAGAFPRVTNAMAKVGQYGLEGGFLPKMGTPAQAAGAAGMGIMAGAVNNPEAALQFAAHPIAAGTGLAHSAYNAVVNPQESWVPQFTDGMTRLLSGQVGGNELAGAVGDATMVRPVFNAGMRMGNTLNLGLTQPGEFANRFGRGLGAIGNAMGF